MEWCAALPGGGRPATNLESAAAGDKSMRESEKPASEGGEPIRRVPLPFHRPTIGVEEEAAVLEVLRSGWLTRGARTATFEARLKEYTGAPHVLALNSCTAALELALILARVGPGDEVITTAMTFAATANVISHRGARPVLVDVESDTLNIDPAAVEAAVTPRTRAVMAVDFAGHPAEYDPLQALCRREGLTLVEDAAHALESRYKGRPVGGCADFACLSFYANKNLTTGEGGALLSGCDAATMERAAVVSLHGMSRHAWNRFGAGGFRHYDITEPGHKWNMFDLQAALGLAQIDRLEPSLARREAIVARYEAGLGTHPAIDLLRTRPHVRSARHLFMIRLRPGALRIDRDAVLDALKAEGIGVAVHYRALPQLSWFREGLGDADPSRFPVATAAGDSVVSLPLFPSMTDRDVDDVLAAVRRILDWYLA
jgi:dTDP-4-amino-4,6-dideoxygalactose transaminase